MRVVRVDIKKKVCETPWNRERERKREGEGENGRERNRKIRE